VKILKVQGFDSERFEEFLKEVFVIIFIHVLFLFFSRIRPWNDIILYFHIFIFLSSLILLQYPSLFHRSHS
jgi:hypothetical protein